MCLHYPVTKNFDILEEYSYKFVIKLDTPRNSDHIYMTPFQARTFKNKLEADGEPQFGYIWEKLVLNGGAIHCYRRLNDLRISLNYVFYTSFPREFYHPSKHSIVVLKVRGKDPIAYNEKEVAFKEIEVVEEISG